MCLKDIGSVNSAGSIVSGRNVKTRGNEDGPWMGCGAITTGRERGSRREGTKSQGYQIEVNRTSGGGHLKGDSNLCLRSYFFRVNFTR